MSGTGESLTALLACQVATSNTLCQLIPWSELGSKESSELSRLAEYCEHSRWFMGPEWYDAYVKAFAPDRPHLFVARESDRMVAALPMQYGRETWMGRSITVLVSMTNRWSPRFEMLFETDASAASASVLGKLIELSDCPVVYLDRLPCNTAALRATTSWLEQSGVRHHFVAQTPSPYKVLPSSADELITGLDGKFRSNLRNRERRLAKLGQCEFGVTRNRQELLDALEQFFLLEQAGWKGAAKGAILSNTDTPEFYRAYCSNSNVEASIALLKVDDAVIAAQMLLISPSTLFLLKTTYDEGFRAYSPGQLLTRYVMEHAIALGVKRFDFLGRATDWKLDWGCELHDNTCLYMFADSFMGEAAYWTKFGIRKQLKKIGPLRTLVRQLRTSEKG